MSTTARVSVFGTLFIAMFLAAMFIITNGVIDIAAWASALIVLLAEAIVLGMIYMSSFHAEEPEDVRACSATKVEFSRTRPTSAIQHVSHAS